MKITKIIPITMLSIAAALTLASCSAPSEPASTSKTLSPSETSTPTVAGSATEKQIEDFNAAVQATSDKMKAEGYVEIFTNGEQTYTQVGNTEGVTAASDSSDGQIVLLEPYAPSIISSFYSVEKIPDTTLSYKDGTYVITSFDVTYTFTIEDNIISKVVINDAGSESILTVTFGVTPEVTNLIANAVPLPELPEAPAAE